MSRRKYSFVVHLWFDGDEEREFQASLWRGSIEHLPTQQRLYFSEFAEMVRFLASWIGRHSKSA